MEGRYWHNKRETDLPVGKERVRKRKEMKQVCRWGWWWFFPGQGGRREIEGWRRKIGIAYSQQCLLRQWKRSFKFFFTRSLWRCHEWAEKDLRKSLTSFKVSTPAISSNLISLMSAGRWGRRQKRVGHGWDDHRVQLSKEFPVWFKCIHYVAYFKYSRFKQLAFLLKLCIFDSL